MNSFMNNLYTCDDCDKTDPLWKMHKRSHGGYDCPLCSGEVSLTFVVNASGCLRVAEKEKLEE